MNKKLILTLAVAAVCCSAMAQDDEKVNLVENGSFEEFEGNLRRYGEFGLTKSWANASGKDSELYSANVKSRYVAVPKNVYGDQDAFEGDGYAGINFYSYRNEEPRSYITTKLTKTMKQNGLYCVKYRVSLAERSRYAVNNLGAVLSKKEITQSGTGSIKDAGVLNSSKNEVVNDIGGWYEFCKLYNAKGDERYLTIGNFEDDSRVKTETMELPSEFAEAGQENMAYYYIDGVEVLELQYADECNCSSGKIPENKIIFSSSAALNDDMTITEKVEAIDAYFYQYSSEVVSAAERSIDKVIEMMKANPVMKVQIVGHSDNEEFELGKSESTISKLARDRAMNVMIYMESQGISRSRLSTFSEDNKKPVSTMSTPLSLAKNRRVEFVLNLK